MISIRITDGELVASSDEPLLDVPALWNFLTSPMPVDVYDRVVACQTERVLIDDIDLNFGDLRGKKPEPPQPDFVQVHQATDNIGRAMDNVQMSRTSGSCNPTTTRWFEHLKPGRRPVLDGSTRTIALERKRQNLKQL